MRRLDSNGSISAFSSSVRGGLPVVGESENGGGDDQQSESGKTVTSTFARSNNQEESEKMRKVLVESLWKSVMEPALEYSYVSPASRFTLSCVSLTKETLVLQNFIHALLTPPSSPSPLSLISMIRLNNTILSFTSSVESSLPCPPLESHLYSIRLLLWPLLTKILDAQIESLKKINGSPSSTASSGVGGLLGRMAGTGGGGASVKDSTVQAILERYVEWFVTIVEICSKKRDGDGDVEVSSQEMAEDEPVFQL